MWPKEVDVMEELEAAHKDYEKRKNEVITKLTVLRNNACLQWHERQWLNQAIEFIKEREI